MPFQALPPWTAALDLHAPPGVELRPPATASANWAGHPQPRSACTPGLLTPHPESAGTRDSADRSSAQPGSSRSVQPRQPIITRSQTAADRDKDLQ
ncbi:hypothetical protein V6N12_030148 [Hibiscus sabdariffa]|uniref:Uncharacterized protein n=1 Tax=Hibiscus sabdariffa TaxID=183260 RepID=A0ABR2C027_9ROSI